MSRPTAAEIAKLTQVAKEVRDGTEEYGYLVSRAVGQHKAFRRTRGTASGLERDLVYEAAARGASQAGLWAGTPAGGGLEIITNSGTAERRYRVKRLKPDREGGYRVICGAGSSLIVSEPEPETLFLTEKWVFGFIMSDDHSVDRLVVAEIVGWHGSGPLTLEFGLIIDLEDDQTPRGFTSTYEDLEGFGDEDGDTGNASGA